MNTPKAFMVLGTSSGAGKSLIAAAFCRLFSDWGWRTAPFKAQNMSNNSCVTEDGGEIGRAQAVQAECARVKPSIHMNPILMKPSQDNRSQVIVQGKSTGNFAAREYYERRDELEKAVRGSFGKLAGAHDVIVLEGAGSPAEINLKQFDLVNMRMAEIANARCVLAADIDRGGVFASVIGTVELLEPHERARIDGILINKFRGDRALFKEGVEFIEKRTGIKVWGVLPYAEDLWIDEEDALDAMRPKKLPAQGLDIAVVLLPRISNFTDFGILSQEPGVRLRYVSRPEKLGNPDLLILPGTKATAGDFAYLCEMGFKEKILEYARTGRVLGICGGYQMLGKKIVDEHYAESSQKEIPGLGLLHMITEFHPEKILRRVEEDVKLDLFGSRVEGRIEAYEIHMGRSHHGMEYRPFGKDGAVSPCGRIAGTYYHGLFDRAEFRSSFLKALAKDCGKSPVAGLSLSAAELKEKHYSDLAAWLANSIDLDLLKQTWNIAPRKSANLPS